MRAPQPKRAHRTSAGTPQVTYTTCGAHGKRAYHSRKDAKAVLKFMRMSGSTERPELLGIYECDHLEGRWHIGNHPSRGR